MTPKKETVSIGHLCALTTILIWGTTFISTKVLLREFSPIEILFTRFAIGFVVLLLLYPHRLKIKDRREELLFLAAGFSGITLYYLLENIALTLTSASNVGIIISIAPFFTALFSRWFLKSEKPKPQFYVGFVAALIGVAMISYDGSKINPIGDLLALAAAIAWAVYSIITKKISELGYNTIQTTRRVFLYGLLFMIPMLFFMEFQLEIKQFASLVNFGNVLFLGLGASALCFVTWNTAVKLLGAVRTSVYIYLVPVVTVAASAVLLKEPITIVLITGVILILAGLWLSETEIFQRRNLSGNHKY